MRKEIPRDSVASRPVTKPASSGKAVKRAAPTAGKTVPKKKKPVDEEAAKPSPGQSDKKKKLMKPKVVLTKLPPGAQEQTKPKVVKETKKETIPKTVKPKPKKVIVSKAAKKVVKLEHDPKRATKAKIVRAVKDVKKARSLVASKMAKTSTKKPASSEKAGKSVNLVKKHNIVKSVNKMSGKKPCVVSVKISNAHSTVTLSVKQNKQVAKKDNSKNAKPSNEKGSDRSTISIVKKGIASRRKSTSKDGTSQESSPSQSPTRSVSPGKGSNNKSKKSEIAKSQKKNVKETDSKKCLDDKSVSSKTNDNKIENEKTEYIINDSVKIKTENLGEQQNMEIEFTDGNITDKTNEHDLNDATKDSSKRDDSVFEFKAKSPLRDYNLKSIESCTSDEMPLEVLKCKERIKQEKESTGKRIESKEGEKMDLDRVKFEDGKKKECATDGKQTASKKKLVSGKQNKSKVLVKVQKTAKQSDNEKGMKTQDKSKEKLKGLALKQKVAKIVRKSRLTEQKQKKVVDKGDSEESSTGSSTGSDRRRMKKLYKFWSGPKRHRVASLNAIAKVHCLYENESRGALNEVISNAAILQRAIEESKKEYAASKEKKKGEEKEKKVVPKRSVAEKKPIDIPVSRNLRTNPGVRSVGRNFDILNVISSTSLSSSSSSEESSDSGEEKKQLALLPSVKQKQAQIKKEESDQTSDEEQVQKPSSESNDDTKDGTKKVKKRRRKRNELTMDLKDMVVRKRMASLNASAIMTATYSTEKKVEIKPEKEKKKIEESIKKERKKKKKSPVTPPEIEDSSADEDMILRATNNKQKVAVIVNQDTDVTITGVYVNSTTRSTHHEGYCSIAGMQYRISSTSHTQTEATAVSTETVLHTDHPPCLPEATATTTLATPCKSYTPLNALSSMQPPGQMHPHGHPPGPCPPPRAPSLSPLQRRHGCTSAFSAPPNYPQPGPHPPPPPQHPDVHGNYRWEVDMPCCSVPPPRLCYYQPAGPLISTHHHHHHTSSSSITSKLQPPPLPSPTPPPSSAHPTSHSESSDTDVVLTSASENPPPVRYSYPPHGQPYNPQYYQYYPSPPASSLQYPGPQNHYHQDVCYSSPSGYPPGYYPKGHYPPPPGGYPRRYGPPHQYYPPQEYYPNPQPPSGANPPPPPSGNNQQMMVSANPPSGQTSTSYPPPADGNYPTPAPMVDPYPPPPPQPGYYPGYSTGPPSCYTTHSPSSRGLFLDPAYQGCPCPMQSCPKNVHTGPLTGASKGSLKNHQTTPLPPVALALPLEPPGALGPPSPARGSAGMPPPPSPALATAYNPPQWAESPPAKPLMEQTGLLTISKMVTDAVMLAEQGETNLAELLPRTEPIKQEIEDIVKIEVIEDAKCNRKRRKSFKSSPVDIKRQSCEPMNDLEVKVEVQERLTTLKVEPEKTPSPELETVEKQLPLSDNGATVPVKNSSITVVTNCVVSKEHPKKRKLTCSEIEIPAKIAKCTKSPKVVKKCVKKSKTEENIAPESDLSVNAAELVKVECRRNNKSLERRKSLTLHQTSSSVEQTIQNVVEEIMAEGKTKKMARTKKLQGKTKADHQLRSHGKPEASPAPIKERRHSKAGSVKSEEAVGKSKKASAPSVAELDPSAESQVCLPGLRRSLGPRWSNGWSWEGTPYKAKIFLNMDDKEVVRKCYPAMRHVQGDVIYPRDSILLKAGPRKIDLPFVAKVAAMWENPDDGEMMVSLLWYYRPEHTEQGRRPEDSPDEIFASRHKDTNSVACIEDKCFVLSFNEYCRYRKTVRRLEEGLNGAPMVVPALEDGGYPRSAFQPPGVVAPDLVFFCRRVYDFRQKRILKNPC